MATDRNAPATKGDLEDLESRLDARLSGEISSLETRLDARLTGELSSLEARLTEQMRDMQTEILKAFYGFTESVQSRFKAQDDTEAGLKHRLTVLETRLLEVERRLNMPPAA